MKRLLIVVNAITLAFAVFAYDMTVIFRVDETNDKTIKFAPRIVNTTNFAKIADSELNESDSVFLFKHLPDSISTLAVLYNIDGKNHGKRIKQHTDTMTIYIPAFYVREPEMLKEVTVTASDRSMSAEKETYIPTSQNKRISADGSQLIQNIGITTLKVSPVDGTIRTITGEPVSTFIDFRPASRTDVRNIRAEDVKRVEVYDYPSDPRFGGARHVVNYVMAQYEFGGYSKIDAGQYTVLNSGMYGVYSKLAYKKMIYDVGVDFEYLRNRHSANDATAEYIFPEKTVEQTRQTVKSLDKKQNVSVFFRAVYQTKKTTITNTFSFTQNKRPDNLTQFDNEFSSQEYKSGLNTSIDNDVNRSFSWTGNYQFFLSKTLALVVSPKASYARNKRDYLYEWDGSSILNLVDEKAWNGGLSATLRKSIGKQSVSANLYGNFAGNNIDYGGTTPSYQEGRQVNGGLWLQANLNFGKLTLNPSFTAYAEKLKINGKSSTTFNPKYYLFASYLFSSKNRLQLSSQYYQQTVPQSYKTDFMQIQNQIMAVAGNSELKMARWFSTSLAHTYFPLKFLSLSAFGSYTHTGRMITCDYLPVEVDGRDMILRKYVNDGHSNKFNYGLTANCDLLKNSLHLFASVDGTTRSVKGPFTATGTHFMCNLEARYTFSDFFISAYYQSKQKTISSLGINRIPDYYFFTVGWGNGNLQLQAMAIRPFSSSYRSNAAEYDSRYYRIHGQDYAAGYHCRFIFSATYSFSYGKKKVSKEIDTDLPTGPESQILK